MDGPDARASNLMARQHGVAHRRQLLACGLNSKMIQVRVKKGTLMRVHPEVYGITAVSLSWQGRLLASQLWLGERSVVSHRAAAALLGLDGFDPELVEITVPLDASIARRAGVRVHQSKTLDRADIRAMGPLRLTKVERTLVDLCAVVSPGRVEEALESALFQGLTTYQRVAARFEAIARPGMRKMSTLAKLLDERDPRQAPAQSIFETKFYRLLKSSPLEPAEFQYSVFDADGFAARPDVAYPDLKIAVEAHSMKWHVGRKRVQKDTTRHNRLTELGWQILYVTYEDLQRRPHDILRRLEKLITARRAALDREVS